MLKGYVPNDTQISCKVVPSFPKAKFTAREIIIYNLIYRCSADTNGFRFPPIAVRFICNRVLKIKFKASTLEHFSWSDASKDLKSGKWSSYLLFEHFRPTHPPIELVRPRGMWTTTAIISPNGLLLTALLMVRRFGGRFFFFFFFFQDFHDIRNKQIMKSIYLLQK